MQETDPTFERPLDPGEAADDLLRDASQPGKPDADARAASDLAENIAPLAQKQKEAAEALGIRVSTARVHIGRIFQKTGVHSQAELMALMMRTVGSALDFG